MPSVRTDRKGQRIKTISKPEQQKLQAASRVLIDIGDILRDEAATKLAADVDIIRAKYSNAE